MKASWPKFDQYPCGFKIVLETTGDHLGDKKHASSTALFHKLGPTTTWEHRSVNST